jgi:hypothetical protein
LADALGAAGAEPARAVTTVLTGEEFMILPSLLDSLVDQKALRHDALRTRFKMTMALLPLLAVQSYCLRRGA